jgi:zeta-carotene desaturase
VIGRGSRIAASPGETVESWLIRNGQSARLRELLWEPLALAALNQPASQAAAPVFARVLGEMFGQDSRASAIALPSVPLQAMYAEPARAYIEHRGGTIRTGAPSTVRVEAGPRLSVVSGLDRWRPRAVIAAVPWFAVGDLFEGDLTPLAPILKGARAMACSPIVTVNAWFDRRLVDEPFIGLPGRTMQWVFAKESSEKTGGSYLSLVSSGASSLLERSNAGLIALAVDELIDALPGARASRLVRAAVVRERRATFSLAPGQPERPGTCTPVENLYLAGDWIATGLPATIESAVRSGHLAADAASEHALES